MMTINELLTKLSTISSTLYTNWEWVEMRYNLIAVNVNKHGLVSDGLAIIGNRPFYFHYSVSRKCYVTR